MKVEDVAKICHEANKAYCESLGDMSQPSWAEAPDWQKNSAMNGVYYHLKTDNASPSASHDNWLREKANEGWKYGAVKNAEKKEHPCFVPYNQLPKEQIVKDILFMAVVEVFKEL